MRLVKKARLLIKKNIGYCAKFFFQRILFSENRRIEIRIIHMVEKNAVNHSHGGE